MTAQQWERVFRAGANAISGIDLSRNGTLPGSLYGPAALSDALTAMGRECEQIARETA